LKEFGRIQTALTRRATVAEVIGSKDSGTGACKSGKIRAIDGKESAEAVEENDYKADWTGRRKPLTAN
jgi:hypothetical protein